MINLKNRINNIYICSLIFFILGMLFVLGFPPYGYFVLSAISIVATSFYVRYIKGIKLFIVSLLSYVAGICLFGFYWIYYSIMYVFPNYIIAGIIFIGFILLYSIFLISTWFILYKSKYIKNDLYLVAMWIAWVVYEVSKHYLFTGFPWFPIAQLWSGNLTILQSLYILKVLGLSIITLMLIFSICSIFIIKNKIIKIIPCLSLIIVFIMIYLYGDNRLSNYIEDTNNEISLRLISTDINQADKYRFDKQEDIFNNTVKLIKQKSTLDNLDYIILPEVAFGFVLEDNKEYFDIIKNAIPVNSKLILGVLKRDYNKYYNSMYIIDGESKEIVYSYDKIRLVPFGEYMPFISNFAGIEGLQKGEKLEAYIDDKLSITPAICFEGVFEAKIDKNIGNSLLLTIGNEAWFDDSIEKEHMLSLFQLRVIESGVLGVKVSNKGLSAVIDKLGRYKYISKDTKEKIIDIKIYL